MSVQGRAYVGVPLWLWVEGGQPSVGPLTATATAGAAQVTATARLARTVWAMGPPGAVVTCPGSGTPYNGASGASPDCGYTYTQRSLPHRTAGRGTWPVTVTTVRQVTWTGIEGGAPVVGTQEVPLTVNSVARRRVAGLSHREQPMTAPMTATTTDRSPASPIRALGRHRSRMTMVGVLLAIVGGLAAWFAYSQATQGQQVVATARSIAYGATIADADLRPVEIPTGSTLRVTAWSNLGTIVGHVTTADLAPDSLVAPDAVAAARLPGRGEAIVGFPVAAGRLPVSGLLPRDVVKIVDPAATQRGLTGMRATVLAIGDPDATGRRTVDLVVPDTAVEEVAAAAGNDNTLLVLVGSGG
jgi:hypothetical protein